MELRIIYPDGIRTSKVNTLNDVYSRLRNFYASDIESGLIDSIEIIINHKKQKISLG